ncbi:hypothetical protein ACFSSN_22540 [Sinorhizobium terangae]|uniref:hypothetical protein n=1 Tax=Sinorhizobium terangae TaxID=110322 RepID=UPI003635A347
MQFVIACEPGSERWLLLELQHHLIGDHTTLEVMHAEVRAVLEARAHELAAPQPFRNLVAQARLGVDAKAHEAFFRRQLGDIDEPTLPFGLGAVRGDGSDIGEVHRMLPQGLNDRLRAQARRLGVSLASLCHLAWGPGGGAKQRPRAGGVRHGAVRPHACRVPAPTGRWACSSTPCLCGSTSTGPGLSKACGPRMRG